MPSRNSQELEPLNPPPQESHDAGEGLRREQSSTEFTEEREEAGMQTEHGAVAQPAAPSRQPAESAPSLPDGPLAIRVESLLEEGLQDAFGEMDDVTKQAFRVQGEETARTISALLHEAKVQVRKIVQLITDWLKMIPGASAFFVDQEAKLKTDRILRLRELEDGELENEE